MPQSCPDCGQIVALGLMHCPNCGRVFVKEKPAPLVGQAVPKESEVPDEPEASKEVPVVPIQSKPLYHELSRSQEEIQRLKEEVSALKSSRDTLAAHVTQAVLKTLKGRVFFLTFLSIWTVALTVLCGYFVYQLYQGSSEYVDKAIAKKFEEPHVQDTFQKVARQEAKSTLLGKIQPNVSAFNKQVNAMRKHLDELDASVDSRYESVAKELVLLEAKRKLSNLADRAQQGYRRPYDDLREFAAKTESLELKKIALQQLNKIEGFFETTHRAYDTRVNYVDDDGVGYVDREVPTRPLIEMMLYSPSWKMRARAATLLKDRIEPGVAEALLLSAQKDPFLDVIQRALDSFESVTGYKRNELFGYDDVETWWKQYRPSYEAAVDSEIDSSSVI